jgi:hypothetical protein
VRIRSTDFNSDWLCSYKYLQVGALSGLNRATWHVLDANSIWIKEFSSALSGMVPASGWVREMSWTGMFRSRVKRVHAADPPVDLCYFPLQRGYTSRFLRSWRFGEALAERIADASECGDATESPLICTTPYYAPVAELWPGPVVYYLTDLTKGYAGADAQLVQQMDRQMCNAATLVCPNSQRIANYLRDEIGCAGSKIVIVPNATRRANVFGEMPQGPGTLPDDLSRLSRPVAGVIGNLAANLDWVLMRKVIDASPGYSWAFVGPTKMGIPDMAQRRARQDLISRGGNVVFTGEKPYGQLRDYARCFDVAILPYQPPSEPTYSGSSTRFYEHLAACRPMVSTRGFEELLHKEPLLRLADNDAEMTAALAELRAIGFRDGHEESRWHASQVGTWEDRAGTVVAALRERLGIPEGGLTHPAKVGL